MQGQLRRGAPLPKQLTVQVTELGRRSLWADALHKVAEARNQELLDVVLCNAAVMACARGKAWQAALAVFQSMAEERLRGLPTPDTVTFNSALRGVVAAGGLCQVACCSEHRQLQQRPEGLCQEWLLERGAAAAFALT
ncbi:unnamed protein product [Symbiodinium natans]|uniref:Pentatricopeptide repeat-containing protein, chloroplastic n=1 Tax=Symbiodinium natans TaxID=878477 RepID=A0A812PMH9_9DINO|nr:unnamed protein product [Symbiodinium natans]